MLYVLNNDHSTHTQDGLIIYRHALFFSYCDDLLWMPENLHLVIFLYVDIFVHPENDCMHTKINEFLCDCKVKVN